MFIHRFLNLSRTELEQADFFLKNFKSLNLCLCLLQEYPYDWEKSTPDAENDGGSGLISQHRSTISGAAPAAQASPGKEAANKADKETNVEPKAS